MKFPLYILLLLLIFTAVPVHASTATYHTITAYVVNEQGMPLQGVTVTVTNYTPSEITSHYLTTNSSGMASISLPGGNYTVEANLTGYVSNTTYSVDTLKNNVTVRFTMKELMANLTGFITTVRFPVANATVILSNSSISYRTLSAAPLGSYKFSDIKAGQYNLRVEKPGYLSNYTSVTLYPGRTEWLNLTITPTSGFVEGIVNETLGNGRQAPLQGAEITIQGQGIIYRTTTNSEGLYFFSNLSQGTYIITVQKPGFSPGQGTVTVVLGKVNYLNFTVVSLSTPSPFTIPGFIGKLDLDHSLVVVTIIIVIFVSSGTLALLNRSYNWKDERRKK
jgi:hypothetical protein